VFTYEELLQAKAVYLSSSIRLLQRVAKIDQKLIPIHKEGSELLEAFESKLLANINP
jgi:branched-subunit amino acid aminotransferase/4-amino-4-deoxychorismate lyase